MSGESAVFGWEKLTWSQEELDALTTEELFETYKRTGNEELKWSLVMRYMGLVKTIALQVRGVYSSFAQVDDIVNEGLLTLAGAVDKFDPDKGIKFETYVSKRIRGAVIDLARRQDWVPRSVRRNARNIDQASSELFAELGRYPTDQEMARRLGITQNQYQEDLANSSMCNVLSLDALFEDREQNGGAEVPDNESDSRPAISSSVGYRPSSAKSSTLAWSISRAFRRTLRGTQSCRRARSITAPRIRLETKVSNLMPLSGSNLSTAPTRASTPSLMMSSTWAKLE